MDTDNLSNETYEAVIIEAERFHHNLSPHVGRWPMIVTMMSEL